MECRPDLRYPSRSRLQNRAIEERRDCFSRLQSSPARNRVSPGTQPFPDHAPARRGDFVPICRENALPLLIMSSRLARLDRRLGGWPFEFVNRAVPGGRVPLAEYENVLKNCFSSFRRRVKYRLACRSYAGAIWDRQHLAADRGDGRAPAALFQCVRAAMFDWLYGPVILWVVTMAIVTRCWFPHRSSEAHR
jgi:hypothetical protein